ncbi:MAG TPA: PepSY-associated TM helix domain-containing protein [Ohtaekwangia sp.]
MTIKKVIGQVHLWLGFSSGAIVLFLGITGCILAFEHEIRSVTEPYQFVEVDDRPYLPPSEIKKITDKNLPDKTVHGIGYGMPGKSIVASFYSEEYYYLMYLNPYSGEVLKTKDMSSDFFRIILMGHFYLWLPPEIGQPIVATATLIFVIMMITGIVLWWPKNKAARKQRFSVKWNARWRRVNYDIHNVFGFYMSWVAIFIALTGLVWGFQWFAKSVYWISSGGKEMVPFYMPVSDKLSAGDLEAPAVDILWQRMGKEYPNAKVLEVHIPENDSSAIEVAANPDDDTYWKADYRYFDQYSLAEIPVTHIYGKLEDNSVADRIARMNYDIHVGAIAGLPGKIIAFIASLICASLPVTGVYIWWGRREKAKKGKPVSSELLVTNEAEELLVNP